jgi:hypothetical protein
MKETGGQSHDPAGLPTIFSPLQFTADGRSRVHRLRHREVCRTVQSSTKQSIRRDRAARQFSQRHDQGNALYFVPPRLDRLTNPCQPGVLQSNTISGESASLHGRHPAPACGNRQSGFLGVRSRILARARDVGRFSTVRRFRMVRSSSSGKRRDHGHDVRLIHSHLPRQIGPEKCAVVLLRDPIRSPHVKLERVFSP